MGSTSEGTGSVKQPSTRRDYKNSKGEKVPGVTTVMGETLGWSKQGLIQWAFKLGKEGRSLSERDKAADKGTATHALTWRILGHDDGTELDDDDVREHEPNARRVADAILSRWTILHVELAIVSETHAGTIDLIVRDEQGRVGVVDLKTGKGVYDEVAVQLGAYSRLYGQPVDFAAVIHAHPGEPLAVIDIDGEMLERGAEVFSHLLEVYRLKRLIKVGR